MRTVIFALVLALFIPVIAQAHCDTMEGPVVSDSRLALEKKDPFPVLKWVKPEYEEQVRRIFQKVMLVRQKGPEAEELADMYFFETVVRLHRAGEGAPYEGLKHAGEDPVISELDRSLLSGSPEKLLKMVSDAVSSGIKERYSRAFETKKNSGKSVQAGREFVDAYVKYIHYVEQLYKDASAVEGEHKQDEKHK